MATAFDLGITMARPRKPTAVLELAGAFKKNPDRKRTDEPRPTTTLGDAPPEFDPLQSAVWDEMASEAFWLTGADRFMFAVAVKLVARHRLDCLPAKETPHLLSALNKLGFGPAERSKIKVPGAKEDNEGPKGFDQFT